MSEAAPLDGRWIALEDRAIFRISGPDRVRFLNGQVTNDVSGPLEREAVAACLCSIKGRVEALVWVSATEDSLLLDGELGQRDFLQARLERYLIADDCEIIDETSNFLLIHHFNSGGPGISCRRLLLPGRDQFLKRSASVSFDESSRIHSMEFEQWQVLAAVPQAGLEITGGEFPAELGLDARAVNFHKGCYLGQEIISRIQSVGRVKRRLRVVCTEEPVERGDIIENSFGEKGVVTRNSSPGLRYANLSMAIFDLAPGTGETAQREPVSSFFREGKKG